MKNNVRADQFRNEGNDFFNQGKFREALIAYNKSLCHAVPKSTQLALAYANRSAVYLELKQFDKCLENIQQARDNKYPNEAKLKERETKCKEELEQLKAQKPDGKNDPWTYFKLSYPANKKIPFIVDCLQLNTNEKYGRHIVSNRDLNPGDIIAIEPPTFHSLDKRAWYSKCTFCLKSNMLNLIPCNFEDDSRNCTSAMYCNQECLTKARDRFHGNFCFGFDTLLGGDPECIIVAPSAICKRLLESLYMSRTPQALHSLMGLNKQSTIFDYDLSEQVDDPAADLKYLSIVNNLEADSDKDLESIFRHISSLFVQLTPKFSETRSQRPQLVPLLVEYSTRLALISRRNVAKFQFRGQLAVFAILPFGSLYNHSCDSNLLPALIDNKFVHIVMKPIKKGEQVFVNYSYINQGRIERQASLLKNYGFSCSCAACLNDWPMMSSARFDPKFVKPAKTLPATIQGSMTELSQHFKYIKDNFKNKNYPSYELHFSILRCKLLLSSLGDKSSWPF